MRVTDAVETMHHNIIRRRGVLGRAVVEPAPGLTGFVYRRVRGVTRLAGTTFDALLTPLVALFPRSGEWQGRDAVIAAINGVLGDHLEATRNPLQIRMHLRMHGKVVDAGSSFIANPRPRVIVMVHGLCMTDTHWTRDSHDHGQRLASDLDAELVHLRYNSGRHISTNGAALAQLLDAMVRGWSSTPPQITLVGHSMGGLVIRSACAAARAAGSAWAQNINALVFIGTPHRGAPLERHGHGVDRLFSASPYTVAFTKLSSLRSAGITDLRHGSMRDGDWRGRDRFARDGYACAPMALPDGVPAFTIAGSIGKSGRLVPMVGDGLVPLASALGQGRDASTSDFPPSRSFVARNTGHLDLLGSRAVYAQLRDWLVPARSA